MAAVQHTYGTEYYNYVRLVRTNLTDFKLSTFRIREASPVRISGLVTLIEVSSISVPAAVARFPSKTLSRTEALDITVDDPGSSGKVWQLQWIAPNHSYPVTSPQGSDQADPSRLFASFFTTLLGANLYPERNHFPFFPL